MMALLSVFFAICALVVTAIGLYGTLAYATARRTGEIGIRMALGARRAQVARMVFVQNAAVAIAGTGAGVVAAMLASRALGSFLYGTSTRDPWVFAGSILALALIASAASLLPAIRAAGIQPMEAIRGCRASSRSSTPACSGPCRRRKGLKAAIAGWALGVGRGSRPRLSPAGRVGGAPGVEAVARRPTRVLEAAGAPGARSLPLPRLGRRPADRRDRRVLPRGRHPDPRGLRPVRDASAPRS